MGALLTFRILRRNPAWEARVAAAAETQYKTYTTSVRSAGRLTTMCRGESVWVGNGPYRLGMETLT